MEVNRIEKEVKNIKYYDEQVAYIKSLKLKKAELLELCSSKGLTIKSNVKTDDIIKRFIMAVCFN